MKRRTVIAGTAAFSAVILGGGTLLYSLKEKPTPASVTPGDAPLVRPYSPVLGPANAPVTIVEFFDPACESCRAFYPVVKQIMAAFPGKVRVVLRYAAFHPTSEEAITILEAARLQGVFEPVLEALLEAQTIWAPHGRAPASAWSVVTKTGLDVDRARREASTPGIAAMMKQDAADVKAVGVRGTPTFFVNGKPLTKFGARQLFDLVKSEVEAR